MGFELVEIAPSGHATTEAYRHAMVGVVEELFQVMLGTEVRSCRSESVLADDAITSVVTFEGRCDGAVWFRCSVRQAKAIAGLFMGGQCAVDDEALVDVMRELANIIAGNLRRSMPHGARNGAPAVHRGRQGVIGEMIYPDILQTCFEWNGEAFSLNFGRFGIDDSLNDGDEN